MSTAPIVVALTQLEASRIVRALGHEVHDEHTACAEAREDVATALIFLAAKPTVNHYLRWIEARQVLIVHTERLTAMRTAMTKLIMNFAAPTTMMRISALADDAIGLFLEYRDEHGYDEAASRVSAIGDIVEGTFGADVELALPDPSTF